MNAIDTIEYRGYNIKIHADEYPDSPREWDNLGTMVCWHNRWELGDKNDFRDPDDFQEWLKDNPAIVLPLYLYDHSGLSMSTSIEKTWWHYSWDGGQVGWIYITKEDIRKEYSCKHISKKMLKRAINCLVQEVETYNDYLTGSVYGYVVVNPDGENIDSCWGYYGYDHKKSGLLEQAQSSIDYEIKKEQEYYDKLQMRFDLALV